MSTTSRIGIIKLDGTIESIYCHHNGGLEWNGGLLFEHYQDISKIQALIRLGDISGLRENIAPLEGTEHTFENPQDDIVVAFMRDRGEKGKTAVTSSVREFTELCDKNGSEYAYLYSMENKGWIYADYRMIPSRVYDSLQKKLEKLGIIEPQLINELYSSSFIGILKSDECIQGVHCMFDGYPEVAGKLLYEKYQDKSCIKSLLERGNIRSLSSIEDRRSITNENYNFVNVDTLTTYCKENSMEYVYLYHEQSAKWFLYERQNEQAVTVEPLKQYLEGINIIGEGEVQESTGINPVTYPKELYDKYPDNFSDLDAVYTLLHKMREGATADSDLVGYANICSIVDEFCENDQMMHDYVLLLQGRIDDTRFTYIQNEIDMELDIQLEPMANQSM